MPKKFKGVNSKAEEARSRKDAAKVAEREKKQKEEDDRYWEDDDKYVARKQNRKDEREKKKAEQLERKAAARQALLDEESQLNSKMTSTAAPAKITRAQIQNKETEAAATAAALRSKKQKTVQEQELEENPNQAMAALLAAEGAVEARSVEDAIATLTVQDQLDMHPEKRVKAAYTEFEARELPRLKKENPNLRLSQLKQMLKKDWMKSPENPLNQRF